MNKLDNSVLNGTNEETNQDIGRIRVLETESGIEVKYHITDRERFFSQYSLFAIKTAQSTVEMCRVVFEAKEELSREEFSEFCTDIGQKGEDSTIRKYIAIGAAYERLIQYADKLPNAWTSIYTILQIPTDTFIALAQVGESFAKMSGKQIKALVAINSDSKKSSSTDVTSSAKRTDEIASSASATDSTEVDGKNSIKSDSETTSEDLNEETATSTNDSADAVLSAQLPSNDSVDDEFNDDAKVKANALLERVATTATTSIQVEDDEEFEPYTLVLSVNSEPSDEALQCLFDCIKTLQSKYRLDIELKSQQVEMY